MAVAKKDNVMRIEQAHAPACRFCNSPLQHSFVDLGLSPLCQTQVEPEKVNSVYWESVEWANGVMETVIRK